MIPPTKRLCPTWKKKERMDEKEGKKPKKFLRKGTKEKERKKLSQRHWAEDGGQAIFGLHVLA